MKLLHKIYLLGLLVSMIGFIGCEEENPIVPDPSPEVPAGNQGVYFPSSNISSFELEPSEEKEIELTIARKETSGSAEVPLTVEENTDSIFDVPSSVSFADGEEEVTFTVTFPTAAEGKTYALRLAVEGDEYVNPYASELSFVETDVTRIKWEPIVDTPFIYVDGAIGAFFGVDFLPMYVDAERAELGEITKYRFKNAFKIPSSEEPDADGIFDGYPYNEPGDVDESKDYYTVIEINEAGEVFMEARENGMDWGYGQFIIGSVYPDVSSDKESYPPGQLSDDVIVFPANSLYVAMTDYNGAEKRVASDPTIIYLSKEAFIAANLKIDDFNEVEYELIEGAVSEFQSEAYDEGWNQEFARAIDIDEENEASDYKDLYYLPDLYADGYGLAFYYKEGGSVRIPDNQPTGREAFGKKVFVSASGEIPSSVEVSSKGVMVYTLGLTFHFEDGTELGDFEETYFYSEDPVSYAIEDFAGNYTLTGPSQFGEDPAEMDIEIAQGGEDSLLITGVDYAEEIVALYDAESSTMSIAPQALADYGQHDMTFLTTDEDGVSTTALMILGIDMKGNLSLTADSEADGYVLNSESAGGLVDGYYDLVLIRKATRSSGVKARHDLKIRAHASTDRLVSQSERGAEHQFKIGGKKSPKKVKKSSGTAAVFF